ncbi:hypothetical protein AVEN_178124-1 [Araneus ventricosus]|uniref:Uncharacterized protein n=1 Tax=Araneus ventricosus TaxID=182803 RepID=A0A4Y2MB34_ARAVE|nr:hypothetical protein AVEN_178124-1 [Araneus ventricosus]
MQSAMTGALARQSSNYIRHIQQESAAEVLQGIPSDKLTDLTTIENALEARFGNSHLTQFYRTELKTRRQKPGLLADDVERLMSLAYVECPQDDEVSGESTSMGSFQEQTTKFAIYKKIKQREKLNVLLRI